MKNYIFKVIYIAKIFFVLYNVLLISCIMNKNLNMHLSKLKQYNKSSLIKLVENKINSLKLKCESSDICMKIAENLTLADNLNLKYKKIAQVLIDDEIKLKEFLNYKLKYNDSIKTIKFSNNKLKEFYINNEIAKIIKEFSENFLNYVEVVNNFSNFKKYVKNKLSNTTFINNQKIFNNQSNINQIDYIEKIKHILSFIKSVNLLMFQTAQSNLFDNKTNDCFLFGFKKLFNKNNILNSIKTNVEDKTLILSSPLKIVKRGVFKLINFCIKKFNNHVYLLIRITNSKDCKFNVIDKKPKFISPFTAYKIISISEYFNSRIINVECLENNKSLYNQLENNNNRDNIIFGLFDLIDNYKK